MTRQKFNRHLTRLHKWAGLVLGVQVFFWFASGFFMTLFPIDEVRGGHLAEQKPAVLESEDIIPIEIAMTLYEGDLYGAQVIMIADRPAYRLLGSAGDRFIDARSGEVALPPNEDDVRKTALAAYQGDGQPKTIVKLSTAPREYGGALPVWQVEFDDKPKTRLYFRADTLELTAVRTRLWRTFDLAWKFHIMNPSGEDFSTWWLSLASGLAAIFALSGLMLVWLRTLGRPKSGKA